MKEVGTRTVEEVGMRMAGEAEEDSGEAEEAGTRTAEEVDSGGNAASTALVGPLALL